MADVDPRAIALYDRFTHSAMGRREFLAGLARLTGSVAAASAALALLENNYAGAATVNADDPRIRTARVEYPGETGPVSGYLAQPADGAARHPAVVVIHENRGLNPHIEDVTRRLAVDGFLALAPDGLSRLGGTPADADRARELIYTLPKEGARADFLAAVDWLATHPGSNGKVGCVGFCWGGSMAGQLAVHSPTLAAAVVYYGSQPAAGDVPGIKAPLLLHYAGLDERINAGIEPFVAAMKAAGTRYEMHLYEGVNHAFNNDTNAARYDAAAAQLAWGRTVEFLRKNLT
jgi:carboxymethylenebutenolidase